MLLSCPYDQRYVPCGKCNNKTVKNTVAAGKGGIWAKTRWRIQVMVLLILLNSVSTAVAGWIMIEKEGDISLISNGKLKSSAEGVTWILDGPGNKMIFIDSNLESYAVGTVEDYC